MVKIGAPPPPNADRGVCDSTKGSENRLMKDVIWEQGGSGEWNTPLRGWKPLSNGITVAPLDASHRERQCASVQIGDRKRSRRGWTGGGPARRRRRELTEAPERVRRRRLQDKEGSLSAEVSSSQSSSSPNAVASLGPYPQLSGETSESSAVSVSTCVSGSSWTNASPPHERGANIVTDKSGMGGEHNTHITNKVHSGGAAVEADGGGETQKEQKVTLIASHIEAVIAAVGEDVSRPGLAKTPVRFANAWLDLTKGYEMSLRGVVGDAIFEVEDDSGGMVVVRDIPINSLCEHHLLPFYGKCHIGYLPEGRVLGLSKFPKIVDMFARRLQIQERLGVEIANAVHSVVGARGVAVVIRASHSCMTMRGVSKAGCQTITRSVTGTFKSNESQLKDMMSLMNSSQSLVDW